MAIQSKVDNMIEPYGGRSGKAGFRGFLVSFLASSEDKTLAM